MRLLQAELARNWRIKATVFYDRPPVHFRPATLVEKVRTAPSAARSRSHLHRPGPALCWAAVSPVLTGAMHVF